MAKFCTNCGSEVKPGAKFCENCGQKVEQEQNQQAGAVAGVAAGAASSADISYKKSINDSTKQEGFGAADTQENVHTDANADSNPKVNPDEFKHTNSRKMNSVGDTIFVEVVQHALSFCLFRH